MADSHLFLELYEEFREAFPGREERSVKKDPAQKPESFFKNPEIFVLGHLLGWISKPVNDRVNRDLIARILRIISQRSGDPFVRVLQTFSAFIQEATRSRAGLCSRLCAECLIRKFCSYRWCWEGGEEEDTRKRLLFYGPDALSDADLLEILLKKKRRDLQERGMARDLLSAFGQLRRIGRATPAELMKVKGIGPAQAALLQAAFALGMRASAEKLRRGAPFRSSMDIFNYFSKRLRDKRREEFIALLLDGKNRILKEERISVGSLTASIVHPREVFAPAVRESAGAIVLIHNHPSGDPSPSCEDIDITKRLIKAGRIVGIPILDHIIIGDSHFVSFLERGIL